MSEVGLFSEKLIERILKEEVEEYLYADNEATSTTHKDVQEGSVPDGYIGLIVSLAVSSVDTLTAFIKRDDKQYYENGLNCGGLSSIPEAKGTDLEGVDKEVPLLIRIKEKGKWALGFKATAGTPQVSWRLRVRHYKKG